MENNNNRKSVRRQGERRGSERRKGNDRRKNSMPLKNGENERRQGDRRAKDERRKIERRTIQDRRQVNEEDNSYEDIVCGRNAVLELLKSDKDINKIFIENGEKHGSIKEIIARAKENKVVLVEVEKSKLDLMAENNQGVVAIIPPFNYCEVEEILDYAQEKKEDPFILILDGIEDPHNLGSIIRTAETAGVHGIIIPKRRSVSVNSTVAKVSTGAVSYMKIARVNNLNEIIRKLKVWSLDSSSRWRSKDIIL